MEGICKDILVEILTFHLEMQDLEDSDAVLAKEVHLVLRK